MRVFLDGDYGPRIGYALDQLRAAARQPIVLTSDVGADVVAGTVMGSATIRSLVEHGDLTVPEPPESLTVLPNGSQLIVAGRDEQGLMYALLEVAEQVDLEGHDLPSIRATVEEPATSLRGIFTFLHNADCEREWFYSEDQWRAHFDLLARSRFNSFQLVLGAQTNYLTPPFPFFVEVPEHPEVSVPTLSGEERRRNREALHMIGELAAAHGLEFVLGIWQVVAWPPGTDGRLAQQSMVHGLTPANLSSYTYHATLRLLDQLPGIKGIQLRVNFESGIPDEQQTEFFSTTIFAAIRDCRRDVFLDLRGWLASPGTIAAAHGMGLRMRLSMKYWAEHLGPPYQAAEQSPAYSYADYLRYPRRHPISYQVWALGSHRNFVWGDPAYVRTFARSLSFGDAAGFEISPPLAQKGFGNEPGAWRVLSPGYEYYDWEWERYWLFYRLFGRLTFNPNASPEPWLRQLTDRFGPLDHDVLKAYEAASKVLSFLILVNMSDPNMYIWPEADTGGLLDYYTSVSPSDRTLVKSFRESANEQVEGSFTARLSPGAAATHLADVGRMCLEAVATLRAGAAERQPARPGELLSTIVDVEALGELACFHGWKFRAAEQLALYELSGDLGALRATKEHLAAARPHWERLVAATDGVYTSRQVTGPVDTGHWRDKLPLITEDEQRLEYRIDLHRRYGGGLLGGAAAAFDFGGLRTPDYSYGHFRVYQDTVERGFVGVDGDMRWEWGTTPYGWSGGPVRTVLAALGRLHDRHTDTVFRDTMARPGYEFLEPLGSLLYRDHVAGSDAAEFFAHVPAGKYEVTVILCDAQRDATHHGPFTVRIDDEIVAAGVFTSPGEMVELRAFCDLSRGLLRVRFEPEVGGDWFCSGIVVRSEIPVIRHIPMWVAPYGEDLVIRASVHAPYGIRAARVHIANDDGTRRSIDMETTDGQVHAAVVSKEHLGLGERLRYWFDAQADTGRTVRHPHASDTKDAFTVLVAHSASPPRITEHVPATHAEPGQSIAVTVRVASTRPVHRATLHYRYASQYFRWERAVMTLVNDGIYSAEIPADYVVCEWDLMYFVEVIDDAGQGCLAPCEPGLDDIPYWVIPIAPHATSDDSLVVG